MIAEYLERIPAAYRRAFYGLPLFVQWIVALTWERDEASLQVARRSMIAALLFLVGCALVFFGEAIAAGLLPASVFVSGYVAFGLHTLLAVGYLAYSIALSVLAYLDRADRLPAGLLDRMAAGIEAAAAR